MFPANNLLLGEQVTHFSVLIDVGVAVKTQVYVHNTVLVVISNWFSVFIL